MGYLIPPWWRYEQPATWVLEVVTMMLGFFIASALFAGLKATRQTYWILQRLKGRPPTYIIMVWVSWSCGVTQSSINYAYLRGRIEPSFWLFFFQVLIWYTQIQLLMLIMVNRVSLIMYNPIAERRLKLGVLVIITLLNMGVMLAWIPAQLQINDGFIAANRIYHWIEKSIFTIVDASLNCLFIYLVRTKLVNPGLTRYRHLYRFNVAMVIVSISLDITVIGMVATGYPEIFVGFRALSAMLKLHIEITIADFIAKILKASRMEDNTGQINYTPDSGPLDSDIRHTWQSSRQNTTSESRPRSEQMTPIEGARVHTRPSVVGPADRRESEATQSGGESEHHAQKRWSWVKGVAQSLRSPT